MAYVRHLYLSATLEFGGEVAIQFFPKVLKSLKKAVIYPEDMLLGCLESCTVCELFVVVSLVESLSINHYFIQVDPIFSRVTYYMQSN